MGKLQIKVLLNNGNWEVFDSHDLSYCTAVNEARLDHKSLPSCVCEFNVVTSRIKPYINRFYKGDVQLFFDEKLVGYYFVYSCKEKKDGTYDFIAYDWLWFLQNTVITEDLIIDHTLPENFFETLLGIPTEFPLEENLSRVCKYLKNTKKLDVFLSFIFADDLHPMISLDKGKKISRTSLSDTSNIINPDRIYEGSHNIEQSPEKYNAVAFEGIVDEVYRDSDNYEIWGEHKEIVVFSDIVNKVSILNFSKLPFVDAEWEQYKVCEFSYLWNGEKLGDRISALGVYGYITKMSFNFSANTAKCKVELSDKLDENIEYPYNRIVEAEKEPIKNIIINGEESNTTSNGNVQIKIPRVLTFWADIPKTAWTVFDNSPNEYGYYARFYMEEITQHHYPVASFYDDNSLSSLRAAEIGIAPFCTTEDGYIEFYAKKAPNFDTHISAYVMAVYEGYEEIT